MEKTLDLRGLICPEPVLRTKKVLDDQSVQKVEALVESEINVNNLQRLAKSLKLRVYTEKQGTCFLVTLVRNKESESDDYKRPAAREHMHTDVDWLAPPSASAEQSAGTVVFLGKDSFGYGDPDFSTTLLSLFLQSMFDGGHRPRAILMANTGVRLLSQDSASLKVLEDFKAAAVDVLACGLCVDYYQLKDQIPTDQITNMFAICEYMFAADKLIVP